MARFPTRIYLTGFMGSGKSTIGPLLAEALGYAFVDLDERIEAEAGRPIRGLFAEEGEAAFRALEARLLRASGAWTETVVALGGGALTFEANLQSARAQGAIVYLHTSVDELARRLRQDGTDRPLLLDDTGNLLSPDALRHRIETMLARREPFYRRAHHTIDATEGAPATITKTIIQTLNL